MVVESREETIDLLTAISWGRAETSLRELRQTRSEPAVRVDAVRRCIVGLRRVMSGAAGPQFREVVNLMFGDITWGPNGTGRPRLKLRMLRALGPASLYLWNCVPMKVEVLGMGSSAIRAYEAAVWPEESALLAELKVRGAVASRLSPGRSPHFLCDSGYWLLSALIDCEEQLAMERFLPPTKGLALSQGLPEASCKRPHYGPAIAAALLQHSNCLAEGVHWHLACAASGISRSRSPLQIVPFYEIAALTLLLCDGCRTDGRGHQGVALDDVLWSFGKLVSYGQRSGGNSGELLLPSRLALANAVHQSAPRNAWRGRGDEAVLFGRPNLCPTILRPTVCIDGMSLLSSDPQAPAMLPGCLYERNRPSSHLRSLGRISLEDSARCSQAAGDDILLLLPVHPGLTRHLTSVFTWLLPAFAWLYGRTGPRIFAAMWRNAGLRNPPLMNTSSTDVVLVPMLPAHVEPHRVIGSELFHFLSKRAVRSLSSSLSCHCYSRGAVWGHLESPFNSPADIVASDSRALRAKLSTFIRPSLTHGSELWKAARAWQHPTQKARVLFVERGTNTMHPRNATNLDSLKYALKAWPLSGELAVADLVMQRLPLLMQLQAVLHFTEVLVGVFGASLAWVALMPPGSYVVQLHVPTTAGTPHFGSCWSAGGPGGQAWGANPRSEWGAWARAMGIHHACAALGPPEPLDRCRRCQVSLDAWEVPQFPVAVDSAASLLRDAACRILAKRRKVSDAPCFQNVTV